MSTEKLLPLHALPWMQVAEAYERMGILEVPGKEAHPMIVGFHRQTTLKATSDEVPWCSSFACAVFEQCGIKSTRSAAARSWLKWGTALTKPMFGCVVVFDRSDPSNPNAAHVAFMVDSDQVNPKNTTFGVLGGNQRNRVCVAAYPKRDVIGFRWPVGYP